MTELFLRAKRWVERLRARLDELRAAGGGRAGLEAPDALTQAEWGNGDSEERSVCCRGGETLPTAF